jgi:hypothetical protein
LGKGWNWRKIRRSRPFLDETEERLVEQLMAGLDLVGILVYRIGSSVESLNIGTFLAIRLIALNGSD